MMNFRNAKWSADGVSIDMEIQLDRNVRAYWADMHGQWVPFAASPHDTEDYGRELHKLAIEAGGIAEYIAPPPPPPVIPEAISDRQFFQALANRELISEEDAENAVANGTIPAPLLSIVESFPEELRFPARMFLKGATNFERSHHMTETIGAAYGMTPEQIDQLWIDAHEL